MGVWQILDIKWRRFGMKWFLVLEGWYTLILAFFELAFIGFDQHDCSHTWLRLAVGAMAGGTWVWQAFLVIGQSRSGQVGQVSFMGFPLSLPRWLHNRFNCIRMASMAIVAFVGLAEPCLFFPEDIQEAQNAAAAGGADVSVWIHPGSRLAQIDIACAVVAILLCLGIFQFSILSHKLSAFMFTIGTLISDVSRVIAIIVLLTFAFATALTRVQGGVSPFSTLPESMYTLVRKVLTLETPPFDSLSSFGWTLFLIYNFLAYIGMLNILVAQLDQNVHRLARATECYAIQVSATQGKKTDIFSILKEVWLPYLNGMDPLCFLPLF